METLADTQAPTPDTADPLVPVVETVAAAPSLVLMIVMGLAVMLASRPRKHHMDRWGE